MSEIEKMYENAGIEPDINYVCDKEPCEQHSVDCQECLHLYDTREDYPDFTAEKQIELIKWLVCAGEEIRISGHRKGNLYWMSTDVDNKEQESTFEETLAKLVNNLWQSLTSEEKQQVKEILE